jgi:hypothetical protein
VRASVKGGTVSVNRGLGIATLVGGGLTFFGLLVLGWPSRQCTPDLPLALEVVARLALYPAGVLAFRCAFPRNGE